MLTLKWLCSLGSDDLNQYLPVKQPLALHAVKVLTPGSVALALPRRRPASTSQLMTPACPSGLAQTRESSLPLQGAIPPVSSPSARPPAASCPSLHSPSCASCVQGLGHFPSEAAAALPPCDGAATALPQRGFISG